MPEEKSFSGRLFLALPFASLSFSPYAMPLPALPKYRFFGNVLIILELLCSFGLLGWLVGWLVWASPQGDSLHCVLCCLIMGRRIGIKYLFYSELRVVFKPCDTLHFCHSQVLLADGKEEESNR